MKIQPSARPYPPPTFSFFFLFLLSSFFPSFPQATGEIQLWKKRKLEGQRERWRRTFPSGQWKEDETRWKGYATHLPTSIYCDRADYICGRRYIRGESPFNWSPPRIDHPDHPTTVFIRRSCRYAVARWFANHSDRIRELLSCPRVGRF